MSVHICWTEPLEEVMRESIGERYCFTCRKRRDFEHVIQRPIDPMSYYGHNHQVECTICKQIDGDLFPGTEREWND